MRVDDFRVDAELAGRGDADRGERLVDLDGLQLVGRAARALERLRDRGGRLRVQRHVGAGDEANSSCCSRVISDLALRSSVDSSIATRSNASVGPSNRIVSMSPTPLEGAAPVRRGP